MSSTQIIKPNGVSDLLGYKFNRLQVVAYLGKGKFKKHYWLCKCICGGKIKLPTTSIKSKNKTFSCGCLRKEKMRVNRADPTTHGLYKHKLYSVFYAMHYRCSNPKAQRWEYYGGKGISVCKRWGEFIKFYGWAYANGYKEGLSIDREDSNKDYTPENCRWITVAENTRRSNAKRIKPREVQPYSCST